VTDLDAILGDRLYPGSASYRPLTLVHGSGRCQIGPNAWDSQVELVSVTGMGAMISLWL